MARVKNINGTSKPPYNNPKAKGYDSWEKFWEAKKECSFPTYCQCDGCLNHAKVGAHVMKTSNSNKWYIVPLCYDCNKNDEPFDVDENYLVPVSDNNSYSTFF